MNIKKKIKVLIVEDSRIFREALAKGISSDSSIEVVGTASDPFMARDKIIELQPDVMTLDVEMQKMNGIEFLQRLMPQYPIPVIMVSSVNEYVLDAMKAGAVDFVTKPDIKTGKGIHFFINELIIKIKIASTAAIGSTVEDSKIIAIGASTGGTEAIYEIVKQFPKDIPGTVVVQHMPPVFTKMYADRLNNACLVDVKEAQNGDIICPGTVLIAPGEHHMRIKKRGGVYSVECFRGEKVNGHCPSVDVLFHSVAEQAADNAIGVILTGMGNDGAKGLLAMRKKGAKTIGQDHTSCVVYGMPKAAYDLGAVEKQLSLGAISQVMSSMLRKRG